MLRFFCSAQLQNHLNSSWNETSSLTNVPFGARKVWYGHICMGSGMSQYVGLLMDFFCIAKTVLLKWWSAIYGFEAGRIYASIVFHMSRLPELVESSLLSPHINPPDTMVLVGDVHRYLVEQGCLILGERDCPKEQKSRRYLRLPWGHGSSAKPQDIISGAQWWKQNGWACQYSNGKPRATPNTELSHSGPSLTFWIVNDIYDIYIDT